MRPSGGLAVGALAARFLVGAAFVGIGRVKAHAEMVCTAMEWDRAPDLG
ncbi:hypothetical protein [Blastococcus sp. VKM Ac-2987]|nr:hypothetical protein [Blastococcus sp. VKM Ac-2987]MCZ2858034.1 hypothetical protein [Blastococcus sp. VKM Ac-2987]